MGIYVKDMKMPISCYKCPLKQRNGMNIVCPISHQQFSVADVNILEYRLDCCPLIPVFDHGDLVDLNEAAEAVCCYDGEAWLDTKQIHIVIPADKEGE